jgi:hypothetical protein
MFYNDYTAFRVTIMLIDDGRGLKQPVDWKAVKSIDEL